MSKNKDPKKIIKNEAYKGVRDFYPEDQHLQDFIFFVWESTLESFGYEKYGASVLEPTSLYIAKSGEEIVNEQTYNFKDRGDREVTLRPEMTPTIARMISKKKRDLISPIRWYSTPNLFRYERPQKGRLREHWQLNVDTFGIENIYAEIEILQIAATLMRNFGLDDTQFEVKINDLESLNKKLDEAGLNDIEAHQYRKLLDKKEKMSSEEFRQKEKEILGRELNIQFEPSEKVQTIIDSLNLKGITNTVFAPEIVRGFDYYTGIVFEVFSTDKDNNRSLFGGGRYDDLLNIFGDESIPAVGFGMGDVTITDVLETYKLLPEFTPITQVQICPLNEAHYEPSSQLAFLLRRDGLNVSIDYSGKKVGDQIKKADKKKIPFIICLGEDEVNTSKFVVKDMFSGEEKKLKLEKISNYIINKLNSDA